MNKSEAFIVNNDGLDLGMDSLRDNAVLLCRIGMGESLAPFELPDTSSHSSGISSSASSTCDTACGSVVTFLPGGGLALVEFGPEII